MTDSLRTLTTRLIDYAGLFPPASLPMEQAVRNYDIYRHGEHREMLARFIVPASRLGEFEKTARERLDEDPDPWHIALLGTGDHESDRRAAENFNERHSGGALIDVLETRENDLARFEELRETTRDLSVFVELPWDADFDASADALRRTGLRAKLRTGGVSPEAIPPAETVVSFLEACVRLRVPFKATAGLHHPVRCVRPLTYEADPPSAPMHGFVNLFLASAMLYEDGDVDAAAELLNEEDAESLKFSEDAVRWKDREILTEVIAEVRRTLALSFGSCSFDEPLADLISLGWLAHPEGDATRG